MNYRENLQWLAYAEEADILNVALFGFTAKAWREANPELAKKNNVRDLATINDLTSSGHCVWREVYQKNKK